MKLALYTKGSGAQEKSCPPVHVTIGRQTSVQSLETVEPANQSGTNPGECWLWQIPTHDLQNSIFPEGRFQDGFEKKHTSLVAAEAVVK